ncbi:zinc finger protein [Plasmodium cynomolgi strain B]|uniref:Palmitoyltransferase n=1 Tax=Plasmodium cynomolgi (strain B) TaxID=1120755 RepID=K6UJ13_PLACD|nr:zinc finger protein [Plasmodium cynomolgi strain B]GAB65488.1 zinc finger protein [Plasmodium cynomolgi strain B]
MKEVEKPPMEIRQLLPVMFYCMVLLQINVQKQYVDSDLLNEGYTKLLTFHVLLFLFIWSFYKTYTVDPGSIPDTHEWTTEPDVNRIKERGPNGELRYCTHEKKATKRNILKMDHYCPWVANGVGYYNYKFFLLSLFYANLCCLYVEVNCHSSFPDLYANPNVLFNEVFYIFLEIVLAAVILLIIFPFFLFHLYLTAHNYTTLEFCVIGKRDKQSMYDLGVEENFNQVLGDNILLWLLPVGGPKGDGLFYETFAQHRSICIDINCCKL